MNNKQIQFIGHGNMGSAIGYTIRTQTENDIHITIDTKTTQGLDQITRNTNADIVFVCVKPQQINDIILNIYRKEATCVSIMNAIHTKKLHHFDNIIRTMPNLFGEVGAGITGRYEKGETNISTKDFIQQIFTTQGIITNILNEEDFSSFTAFAGCGPAIMAYIEKHCNETSYRGYINHTLQTVGEELGLDRMQTIAIVDNLNYGLGKYLNKYKITHDQLIDKVSSKGGSTEAIIEEFTRLQLDKMIADQTTNIRSTLLQGIYAGKKRADDLTEQYSS